MMPVVERNSALLPTAVATIVVVGAVGFGYAVMKLRTTTSPSNNNKTKGDDRKTNDEPPNTKILLQVYGFLPLKPDPDCSPACIKLLTFLKMTNTQYEYYNVSQHNMKHSPKGKMPYVTGGPIIGRKYMGDSTLIIDELIQVNPTKYDLDRHLSPKERAIATSIKIMLEESCYFTCIVYPRWQNDEQYYTVTLPTYFKNLPYLVRLFIGKFIIRPKMIRDLKGQGSGLLTEEEVYQKATQEIQALSEFLGSNKYILGEKLTTLDATVYGYVAAMIQGTFSHPITKFARSKTNLVQYVERMRTEFWSELQN